MNADGTAGFDATLSASVAPAPLRVAGALLALSGLAAAAVGVVLIIVGWGNGVGRRNSANGSGVAAATA